MLTRHVVHLPRFTMFCALRTAPPALAPCLLMLLGVADAVKSSFLWAISPSNHSRTMQNKGLRCGLLRPERPHACYVYSTAETKHHRELPTGIIVARANNLLHETSFSRVVLLIPKTKALPFVKGSDRKHMGRACKLSVLSSLSRTHSNSRRDATLVNTSFIPGIQHASALKKPEVM